MPGFNYFTVVRCISVSGVSNWPDANGEYVEDSNLASCDSSLAGYPRYRKVDGGTAAYLYYKLSNSGTLTQ